MPWLSHGPNSSHVGQTKITFVALPHTTGILAWGIAKGTALLVSYVLLVFRTRHIIYISLQVKLESIESKLNVSNPSTKKGVKWRSGKEITIRARFGLKRHMNYDVPCPTPRGCDTKMTRPFQSTFKPIAEDSNAYIQMPTTLTFIRPVSHSDWPV